MGKTWLNSKKNISISDQNIEQLHDLPITENEVIKIINNGIEIPDKSKTTNEFSDSNKPELLVKKKKGNKVVNIIVGLSVSTFVIAVLGAIILPNFLSCTGNVREVVGKNTVGTLNRAQQAHHFEKGTFSPNLTESQLQTNNDLGVIIPENKDYNFVVGTTPTVAYVLAIPKNPKEDKTRGFSGAVVTEKGYYQRIECMANEINKMPTLPILSEEFHNIKEKSPEEIEQIFDKEDGVLSCPANMTKIR